MIWVCNDFPVGFDPELSDNKELALALACFANGGSILSFHDVFGSGQVVSEMDTTCYGPA